MTLFAQPAHAEEMGLRQLADQKGISLGAAVAPYQLDDPKFVEELTRTCNTVTPENDLKWQLVHPQQKIYDFSGADKIVDFALKHGMSVRGHTLVWHNQNPPWLADSCKSKEQLLDALHSHIQTVVSRYRGKIGDWDVVNEPIDDNGRFRDNIWRDAIGPEYIELALKWAREADPKAQLFINDYAIEEQNTKSNLLYDLVKDLKARGVPLDGIGMQFHLDGQYMPDWGSIAQNVKRFLDLGLKVQMTELDVRLAAPPTEAALNQQARIFGEAMRVALAFPGAKTYVMWGLYDGHSWIPSTFPGQDAALILDEEYRPKPAYATIRDVLSKPSPDPGYFDRYAVKASRNRILPTFRAVKAVRAPVLDGKASPGEWDRAIAYPYLYNQLSGADLRTPPSQSDLWGKWRLMYQGDTLYGLVNRTDDVTVVTSPNPWDNDCVEIFFSVGGEWKQYRTIVGQNWQEDNHVPGKAVWSKDGSVLEFSVKLPKDLTGLTIGWSTALADDDTPGEGVRKSQLYPVVGNNTGWQGRGFAELTFEGAKGQFVDGPKTGGVPPFAAGHVDGDRLPKIDGEGDDACWKDTPIYSFGYDHLSALDQSQPDQRTIAGDWRVVVNGKTIYGLLDRSDDKTVTDSPDPRKNDHVEISFAVGSESVSLVTVVGQGFAKNDTKRKAKAVWSKDGRVLEFAIEASDAELAGQQARWSIALFDNDRGKGAGPDRALFPFCGHDLAGQKAGTKKAQETGQLQLQ